MVNKSGNKNLCKMLHHIYMYSDGVGRCKIKGEIVLSEKMLVYVIKNFLTPQLFVPVPVRMVVLARIQIPVLVPRSGLGLPVQHVSEQASICQ